jgi:drug/metabolite transporter (DMT)-like permease
MRSHPLFQGILCALGAGLAWGIVFIAPVVLADYPPSMLAFGRYLAFGLIALPLAWRDRRRLVQLQRADWLTAIELSLSGNIVYYLCLSAAIQLAGVPVPSMIIGTLPVVIAIVSNAHETSLPWCKLVPSLAVIAAGITLVNQQEQMLAGEMAGYVQGVVFAVLALACWTWYPVRNARWLRLRPQIASGTWATAQGLATLPFAAAGMIAYWTWTYWSKGSVTWLGPQPGRYVAVMLTLGLLASWLGTLLWNRASKLLPTALVGQLIVFETLAALSYGFLWRGERPATGTLIGIALLVVGVMIGLRAFHQRRISH